MDISWRCISVGLRKTYLYYIFSKLKGVFIHRRTIRYPKLSFIQWLQNILHATCPLTCRHLKTLLRAERRTGKERLGMWRKKNILSRTESKCENTVAYAGVPWWSKSGMEERILPKRLFEDKPIDPVHISHMNRERNPKKSKQTCPDKSSTRSSIPLHVYLQPRRVLLPPGYVELET